MKRNDEISTPFSSRNYGRNSSIREAKPSLGQIVKRNSIKKASKFSFVKNPTIHITEEDDDIELKLDTFEDKLNRFNVYINKLNPKKVSEEEEASIK